MKEARPRSRLIAAARVSATVVSVVGVVLLIRLVFDAASGALTRELAVRGIEVNGSVLTALVLTLPVPLHIIAIGLIVQKRWLPPRWQRVAWVAIVGSGCWLGLALISKALLSVH